MTISYLKITKKVFILNPEIQIQAIRSGIVKIDCYN